MKKTIALLLTAIMVLGLFPMLLVQDAYATGEKLEVTGGTFMYDGLPHYVTAKVVDGVGFTIEYSVDGGKTWTSLPPSLTETGKLTVNVRAIKGSTLLTHAPVVLEVTKIAPAGSTVTIVAHGSNDKAPLRRGPDSNSERLCYISAGETCTLLESGEKWYKVQYGSYEGYVYYWFVQITYVPPVTPGETPDPSTAVLEATGGIFLYDGKAHKVEASVKDGDGFTIEFSVDGGVVWSTAVPSLTEAGKLTVKVRAVGSTTVLTHEDVILQVITELPVGTELTIVEYSGRTVAPVRATASSSGEKLGEVPVGAVCEYLEKSGSWYKIRYGTLEGFVYEGYVQVGEIDLRPVITEHPASCKVVKDNNAMFYVTATGAESYLWQYKKAGEDIWNDATTDATYSAYMVTAVMAIDGYSYRCKVMNEYGFVYSNEAVLTVALMADPTITTQPKPVTAAAGETVTFKVVATGASTYQWQYSKDGSSWKDCAATGYDTDTLSFPMVATYNGRKYRCVVSNVSGSVTSSAVTLSLYTKPTITTQPQNVTVAEGATVTLKVVAERASKYQWQWRTDATTWKDCASTGYDQDTFSFQMLAGYNGRRYRCIVSNASGSVTSNAATLALPGSKPTITTQPKDALVADGATVTFSVVASSSGLSYQWQFSTDGGTTWINSTLTNGTNATFSFTMAAGYSGRKYRCIVSNTAGSVTSKEVTLNLLSKPTITTQPHDALVADGAAATFSVVAAGNDLKYQWQWSKDGTTWKNSTAAGNNKDTFSFTMTTSYDGRKYRCIVSNSLGSVTSSEVTVNLLAKPVITTHPNDASIADGDTVTFSVVATGSELKYQWQWSKDGITWNNCGATGYNQATFSFPMASSYDGRKYRCIVSNSAGSVTSNEATLNLSAVSMPTITSQPAGASASVGETVTFSVAATGSGLKYQWQWSKDGGITWKNCSATGYNQATFSFSMAASYNGRLYRCIVSNSGGSVTSIAASLTLS